MYFDPNEYFVITIVMFSAGIGLRTDYITSLFAKSTDRFLRPIVQSYFIAGINLN